MQSTVRSNPMKKFSYPKLIGSETAHSRTAERTSTGTQHLTTGCAPRTVNPIPTPTPMALSAGLPNAISTMLTQSEQHLMERAARSRRTSSAWQEVGPHASKLARQIQTAIAEAYPPTEIEWIIKATGGLATMLNAKVPDAAILKKWCSYFVGIPQQFLQTAFDNVVTRHPWPSFPLVAEVVNQLNDDPDYRRYRTWIVATNNILEKANGTTNQ